MPLGLNVVRRDLGEEMQREVYRMHKESIDYGLSNKEAALEYALKYGRGLGRDLGEKFVLMYVNELTRDLGEDGRAALDLLFNKAFEKGLIPKTPSLDILTG